MSERRFKQFTLDELKVLRFAFEFYSGGVAENLWEEICDEFGERFNDLEVESPEERVSEI